MRCARRPWAGLAALLLVVAVLTGCTSRIGLPGPGDGGSQHGRAGDARAPRVLPTSEIRSSRGVVVGGGPAAPYNYGPTVMRTDDAYRVWWCSQLPGVGPAGDDILHAVAPTPDSRFTARGGGNPVPVFHGNPGAFDGMHTCDPSVIRVDGRFYLYYTGAAGDHAHGNAIGVASSADGTNWQRQAGGEPIVTPSGEVHRANDYGAGQPSALYLDGWFYLMFTDTTASGAGWNGAGQFVLRARDPEFSEDLQALTRSGFVGVDDADAPRGRSVVDAFSADWMWVEALGAFAIAHQVEGGTRITFWDRGFTRHPYEPLLIEGPWREGPGLIRQPDGHAPVPRSRPCGAVPFDVLRATRAHPAPTGIRYFGLDVEVRACERPERAAAVLDGFAMPSPRRTIDLVHDGGIVRVERRSTAEPLVRRVLGTRIPALDALPVRGTISGGAPALRSPAGEVALLGDRGRLWLVGPEAAAANGSPVRPASWQQWRSHELAGDLT